MEHRPDLPWYRQLHWQVLMAMALGALTGVVFGAPAAARIGWIGDLFMKLLRMIIVPLVLTSIISGVASVGGGRALGRLFSKTLGYYVLSSLLATSVALFMVNIIRPGVGANMTETTQADLPPLETPTSAVQLLLDIVPENVIQAAASADMLALIFFAIVFGVAITTLPGKHRDTVIELFDALFHTMMQLTSGIIKFLPIGVFALITRMVGTTGFESFRPLALSRSPSSRASPSICSLRCPFCSSCSGASHRASTSATCAIPCSSPSPRALRGQRCPSRSIPSRTRWVYRTR